MRYLVTARVKPRREKALLQTVANGTLGNGSIAGDLSAESELSVVISSTGGE
jgi:hypothetical protein